MLEWDARRSRRIFFNVETDIRTHMHFSGELYKWPATFQFILDIGIHSAIYRQTSYHSTFEQEQNENRFLRILSILRSSLGTFLEHTHNFPTTIAKNPTINMISRKFLLLEDSNECVTCNKRADYICERCGDTYCSTVCQLKDWREHRRYCFPIP